MEQTYNIEVYYYKANQRQLLVLNYRNLEHNEWVEKTKSIVQDAENKKIRISALYTRVNRINEATAQV